MLKRFRARYEHAVDKAVFYPGVVDVLDQLSAESHRLGLCTNKPERPTSAVLRHMRLTHYFDAVVCGDTLSSRKPEPAMLQETIRQLGSQPTLYVGDSGTDAETARRAGVPFALFSGGYRRSPVADIHHDRCFDTFAELPGIVGDYLAAADQESRSN